MDKLDFCKQLSKSVKDTEIINPYWKFEHKQILHKNGKQLTPNDLPFLKPILKYFQLISNTFNTEAQCVVIKKADESKIDSSLLRLPYDSDDFIIVVLPQTNTTVSSNVPEEIWQKYIVNKDIVPYARVHSHHIFDAYQSSVDYSTLNSGTLEIVMGHIFKTPVYCYWLDEKDRDTKKYTFKAEL